MLILKKLIINYLRGDYISNTTLKVQTDVAVSHRMHHLFAVLDSIIKTFAMI